MPITPISGNSSNLNVSGLQYLPSDMIDADDLIVIRNGIAYKNNLGNLKAYVNDGTQTDPSTTPWTPSLINPYIWIDASDSSKRSVIDGGVSSALDKSISLRDLAQATNSARPALLENHLNGLDVWGFDGSDFLATTGNFPVTGNAEFTAYILYKKDDITAGNIFGWGNTGVALSAFGIFDDNSFHSYAYAGGNSFNIEAINTNWNILGYTKTIGQINQSTVTTINGTNNGNTAGQSTGVPNIGFNTLKLGQWGDYSANKFIGKFAEMIISPPLDESDRQKMEGYIAHKWGVTISLPSNHPYKLAAPIA